MRLILIYNLLACLFLLPEHALAAVLAIDYGSDWIKASLMKPGVPFDVLLNRDSKRKIQSSVAWKNDERLFAGDAFNLAARFPRDSFNSIKYLQAATMESDAVSFFTTISTTEVTETSRKTIALKRSDGSVWSSEELIAMQFANVRQIAEELAEEKVTDVILTVPPYYTQFERDAVADAVEIAGMKTLALINDGTAVAINYAMNRNFPTPEYHVIYDAGASSIRATVVSFTTVEVKGSPATTHVSVSGVGFNRLIGGNELNRRLRDLLVKDFYEKHKRDITKDVRGMAKLWKESERVKAILSANSEAVSTVESLAFDIDFKSKISRATFEENCADLKDKWAAPIYEALLNAGLNLENITSVIFTGGSTRVPMLQNAVKAAIGEDKIALNVNADEAAVLGAALHGASLSRQFKTKNMQVTDIGAYDVQASYLATSSNPLSRPRTITTLVFPHGSKTATTKTLTFKRKEDFTIDFDYKQPAAHGLPARFMEVDIKGVAEAIGNLTERGAVDPVVKVKVALSASGFVSITDAHAYGEIKDESLTGKLKNLVGAGSSPSEEPSSSDTTTELRPTPSAESSETPTDSNASASDETPSASSSSKVPEKSAAPKPKEDTITLTTSPRFTTIPPMTVEEKKAARSRLRKVDAAELKQRRREEARNTFEGYLYRMRDLLDDENSETPFKKCSQPSERNKITEKLEELFTWINEEGDDADTAHFLEKRSSLEMLESPVVHRYKEIEAFPQALNNSQMWNWSTRLFLTEARDNLTAEAEAGLPSKWTPAELDSLEKTLKDHEVWLNEWVEKQKSVKMNEDPVIETTEMKARAKALEQHLQRLWKRKVPKTKKKVTSTSSVPEPTATEDAKGEKAGSTPVGEQPPVATSHDEL